MLRIRKLKRIRIIVLLVLVFATAYLILFNPRVLSNSIFKESSIPLGSLISWLGIWAYSFLFYSILPSGRKSLMARLFKKLFFVNVIFAAFWGIFSFLLSQSWAFTFKNVKIFYLWITITALVLLIPLILLSVLGIRSLLIKERTS